jgi:hypothetical protein
LTTMRNLLGVNWMKSKVQVNLNHLRAFEPWSFGF